MTKELSGDARIDGLLTTVSGLSSPVLSWQTANELGVGVSLDYSFLSAGTNGVGGFVAMDAGLQANTLTALQHFSDVANVTFNLVGAGLGDMNFGTAALPSSGSSFTAGVAYSSYSYYPQYAWTTNSNVYLTNTASGYDEANVGDSSYTTLLHEIAHALGVEHPFEDILVPVGTDSDKYTVMSYTEYYPSGVNPASLMLYDMLTIQYLYGANHSYNAGDTVIDVAAFLADGPRALWDGAGEDTIDLNGLGAGIDFDLTEGAFNTVFNTDDFVIAYGAEIENVIGTAFGDTLTGTAGANVIEGKGGADTIDAGDGNDSVYGGNGANEIYLGKGKDFVKAGGGDESFFGGNGKDTISYYDSTGGVTIDLRSDAVSGSWADGDTITNFESAKGSKNGADDISGTDGKNTLRSYGGEDSLYGRDGKDKLYGGDNDDKLYGGGGADKLYGGKGADRFDGGKGDDILFGGGGADIFHFDHGEDSDTIKDFEDDVDLIQIDNFTFTGGQTAFSFATQVDADVVFDFGSGDTLTVENATIAQLSNDLDVV
ncbi:hypothetical protein [Planktotalea sp.]|uniref:hypothetical protein n=1 Tax=Planktotalea sp. TaxID=2029877 RepID=UPI003D6C6144